MNLKFMYITNNTEVALVAEKAGVDRIFVDLEVNGKAERQKNTNSVLSYHTLEDVKKIRAVLTKSQLMTRVNPIFDGSQDEIDRAIEYGSDVLMLPMFKTKDDVSKFVDLVDGRVRTVCLLETKEGVENLDDILTVPGVDEYFIGLNDLHMSYGLKFMFELLTNGVVERIVNKFRWAGKPYGFGGVARVNRGMLLANYILAEHCRLGSSAVILARAFCDSTKGVSGDMAQFEAEFIHELQKIRKYEQFLTYRDVDYFRDVHELLCDAVEDVKATL